MAILGFQLVSTLMGASILSKVINYTSFARFLLCFNLFRYVYPSAEEILKAANVNRIDKNRKNKRNYSDQNAPVNISKSISIDLRRVPVVFKDLVQLHYYSDYQWLIDFSLCSTLVFFSNEFVYGCLLGTYAKVNLSILWCILGIAFTIKSLINITKIYFTMTDTADLMIVIMSAFSFLVFSMMILILPEKHLTFQIEEGYRNFTNSITKNFPDNSGPISLISIKGVLAVLSAFIGGIFTHSGLRYGKMYVDAINDSKSNAQLFVLHFSFLFPLAILSLWLVPVQKFLITLKFGTATLKYDDVLALQIYLPLAFCILRFFLSTMHLQSYLNLADNRIKALRKEAGKISIVEFQKIVARIFHCLCLVALQYFAPIILCFNVTLLYKSLSGLSWLGSNRVLFHNSEVNSSNLSTNFSDTFLPSIFGDEINHSVEVWSISLSSLRAVFTPMFYQGLIGYLLWFTVAAIQLTSFLGLVYHKNLNN